MQRGINSKCGTICAKHFSVEELIKISKSQYTIKDNVFPTIFEQNFENLPPNNRVEPIVRESSLLENSISNMDQMKCTSEKTIALQDTINELRLQIMRERSEYSEKIDQLIRKNGRLSTKVNDLMAQVTRQAVKLQNYSSKLIGNKSILQLIDRDEDEHQDPKVNLINLLCQSKSTECY